MELPKMSILNHLEAILTIPLYVPRCVDARGARSESRSEVNVHVRGAPDHPDSEASAERVGHVLILSTATVQAPVPTHTNCPSTAPIF